MNATIAASLQRRMSRRLYLALLALLMAGIAIGSLVIQLRQPTPTLIDGTGMYDEEHDDISSFRWTSSQASIPLKPMTQASQVSFSLSQPILAGDATQDVTLSNEQGTLATVAVGASVRRFTLLMPAGSSSLQLHTSVSRPEGTDWRWLGVQARQLVVQRHGWPAGALWVGLGVGLAAVLVVLGASWLVRNEYGGVAAVTLLGFGLRVFQLGTTPPMMHRDEVVSMVDAWFVSQTGSDHFGHFLPIASFEAFGDWISPMLTYLELPFVALFGPQPFVARLVVAVFSALAIPAIYGLVREFRLPGAALVAALVAALSPWQVFLGRVAIPPSLVPTVWALLLWAAIRCVKFGRQQDALLLALAGGLAIYAYPTMKLAVPLLGLATALLTIQQHGWKVLGRWPLPAVLLAVLWLPFVRDTLFNPVSGARMQLVGIQAGSPGAWLAAWWGNYSVYFQPDLYYGSGGIRKIVQGQPDHGLALRIEAPLLLGALAIPLLALLRRWPLAAPLLRRVRLPRPALGWLAFAALLLAPVGASLTNGNPHAFRASMLAPTYAVMAGLGAAVWWQLLGSGPQVVSRLAGVVAAFVLVAGMAQQSAEWMYRLSTYYPPLASDTWFYADGELEFMDRVVAAAPNYDRVVVDTSSVGRPYIFLLARGALPPADAQASIAVVRNPPNINNVTGFGSYQFRDFLANPVPNDLPVIEATPTRYGEPGYMMQVWQDGSERVLVVRGMSTQRQDEE